MAKKEMSIERLLEQEHYKAIVFLIGTFQQKGIRFLHLNYLLVEKNNISKNLNKFFDRELQFHPFNHLFYETSYQIDNVRFVLPDVEKTKKLIKGERGVNNLTNFLHKLGEKGVITKDTPENERFPVYKLTERGEYLYNKLVLLELAKSIQQIDTIKEANELLKRLIFRTLSKGGF